MQSNRVLTLLLAVAMLTAGCLGGGAEGGASASDPAGDAETDADGPDLTDPETALRDAGSFTVSWRYTGVDASGVGTEVRHDYYADLRAERSLSVTSSRRDGQPDGGASEQFVADGTTYIRTGPATAPTYGSYPGTADVVGTAVGLSQARAYDDEMANRGTETFDGVRVTRYELTEASSQLIQTGSTASDGSAGVTEITDFHYVVLVDADGVSRYESWSFTGRTAENQQVNGEWEYSLTGVGSTTVQDPDWLAAAKAAA
jgi:hypothetical protein